MVEGRWRPGDLGMAGQAIGRELGRGMVRVSRLVVVGLMASDTGSWCTGVIACMAVGAGARNMSACQYIIIVMDRESRRGPSWVGSMTISTGGWNAYRRMVWIGRVVVVCQVASHAGIRRIDVIAVMALNTVVCNRGMFAGQGIVTVMDGERCRFPPCSSGMAGGAGIGYVQRHMVWIGALSVIGCMTC